MITKQQWRVQLLVLLLTFLEVLKLTDTTTTGGLDYYSSSKWDWRKRGDVRAVLKINSSVASSFTSKRIQAKIVWRRHDDGLNLKQILVTNFNDTILNSTIVLSLKKVYGMIEIIIGCSLKVVY